MQSKCEHIKVHILHGGVNVMLDSHNGRIPHMDLDVVP